MTARSSQCGVVSLELALGLPIVALAALTLLHALMYAADVLVVHDAARVAVRAAVTDGPASARAAALDAVPERRLTVSVAPEHPATGATVVVTVRLHDRGGPVGYEVSATARGRVEPRAGPPP